LETKKAYIGRWGAGPAMATAAGHVLDPALHGNHFFYKDAWMNELPSICQVIVVLATDFFFQSSPFSIKKSHLLDIKNPCLDLKLGAVAYGAKVTRLGVIGHGAEV